MAKSSRFQSICAYELSDILPDLEFSPSNTHSIFLPKMIDSVLDILICLWIVIFRYSVTIEYVEGRITQKKTDYWQQGILMICSCSEFCYFEWESTSVFEVFINKNKYAIGGKTRILRGKHALNPVLYLPRESQQEIHKRSKS